jgi:hypothetical protein
MISGVQPAKLAHVNADLGDNHAAVALIPRNCDQAFDRRVKWGKQRLGLRLETRDCVFEVRNRPKMLVQQNP